MSDHSGDADDVSGITWPGFVDIMSSVIMMFIFFVLITAVALYFHTITYKSKLLAQIQQLTEMKVENKSSEQDKKTIAEITEQNKILEAKVSEYEDKLKKTDAKFAESKDQKVDINLEKSEITIFFGADSISLTEESSKKISEFIGDYLTKNDPAKIKVNIQGNKMPDAPTETVAREVAVARMMNARNMFIKLPIAKDNVFVTMANDAAIDGNFNWVKIKLENK